MRLDRELVRRRLVPTRAAARRAIVEGRVQVAGVAETRPAAQVEPSTTVEVDPAATRYVGRGGLKLEAALAAFSIEVAGRAALDVGAATGGFTDCLLRHGATSVVAVDVGTAQLHPRLAADPRVENRQRTDVRSLERSVDGFDIVVVDVSFVSLVPLAESISGHVGPDGDVVLLVKPQFEAGPDARSKRGVVTDERLRRTAVDGVAAAFAAVGLAEAGRIPSPLPGRAGNQEVLLWVRRDSGRSAHG